jgi:hypothetical protein
LGRIWEVINEILKEYPEIDYNTAAQALEEVAYDLRYGGN